MFGPINSSCAFHNNVKKNNWERFIFLVNKPDHKSIKFIQTSNLASFLIKFCVLFKFLETVLPTEKEKKK